VDLLLNVVVSHSREIVTHSREVMSYLKWTSFKRGCAPQQRRYVLFKVNVLLNAVVPHSRKVDVLLNTDVLYNREIGFFF
jgi:hypothetical protein